jgi:hypothetical protein
LKGKKLLMPLMLIPIFFVTIPLSMLVNARLGITPLYVGDISRAVPLWYFFLVLFSLLLTIFIWLCVNSKFLVAKILGFSVLFAGLALGILILVLLEVVRSP